MEKDPASYPPSCCPRNNTLFPFAKAPPDSKANKKGVTQVRFEAFSTPHMCCGPGVALLCASVHTTRMAVGSRVVPPSGPLSEGEADVTEILTEDYSFTTAAKGNWHDVEGKLCFVALDLGQETPLSLSREGPGASDGQEVALGNKRSRCPARLLQPSLLGLESCGIS